MTAQELEAQLLSLTAVEKIEAIRILTQNINQNSRVITKNPGVMGGDACIAGTRIPVWLLVNYRSQGANDADILEAGTSVKCHRFSKCLDLRSSISR